MYFSPCQIVVLDPHTPKNETKTPIYDPLSRFFNFFRFPPKNHCFSVAFPRNCVPDVVFMAKKCRYLPKIVNC